jgi:hypothetical protein
MEQPKSVVLSYEAVNEVYGFISETVPFGKAERLISLLRGAKPLEDVVAEELAKIEAAKKTKPTEETK